MDHDLFLSANGQWNQWGHWSGCSKSCDGGWERRMRTCQGVAITGQQCEGTGEEVRRCSEQRCPGENELRLSQQKNVVTLKKDIVIG